MVSAGARTIGVIGVIILLCVAVNLHWLAPDTPNGTASVHQGKQSRDPPNAVTSLEAKVGPCSSVGGCVGERIEGVFYNRIPKCASRTVFHILRALGQRNDVHVHNVRPMSRDRRFEREDWDEIRRNVSLFETPFFYGQHFHYFDFNNGQRRPVTTYINVVRDPVERVVSRYYYRRYGLVGSDKNYNDNMALDDCLLRKPVYECLVDSPGNPIQFLCGHDSKCRNVSKASMELAKRNVERHYLVIGMVENLPDFFSVLEYLLPSFFSGARREYDNNGSQKHDKYRTAKKQTVSQYSRTLLKAHLAVEYELYKFITARFDKQMKNIIRIRGNNNE